MMDKLEFKKQVLQAGKAKHQTVIDDFCVRIKELRQQINQDEEIEPHTQADDHTDGTTEQLNKLADELNFANEELDRLNKIVVDQPHETVSFDSVVETDQRTFFVSVSIEDFEVNGKAVFDLSTETPLYQEMKGKKRGDTFAYRETQYRITDLY